MYLLDAALFAPLIQSFFFLYLFSVWDGLAPNPVTLLDWCDG
jgi:hypothetical protein